MEKTVWKITLSGLKCVLQAHSSGSVHTEGRVGGGTPVPKVCSSHLTGLLNSLSMVLPSDLLWCCRVLQMGKVIRAGCKCS